MAITEWPEAERPREKLLQQGVQSLSDAELLAIFIRTGVRGKTAVDVARDLINEFGGLRKVLTADKESICSTLGFGPAKYAMFQAAREIGKRFASEKLRRDGALTNPKQVSEYLIHQLRDQPREVFAIIYLDNRHQVIQYEELFYGTLNGATVHPREVVKSVLSHNAAAVIIAHNHPSGIAEPSQSDTVLTLKLQESLQLIDVKLLDHLVIGDGEFVSFSDRGLI